VRRSGVLGFRASRNRHEHNFQFLDTIDAAVPNRFDIHMVLDNYGTHKTPMIHRWLVKRPRFHLHFTPAGTSWINQVERWFALSTEKRLRRSAFRSTRELESAIRQYVDRRSEQPKPFRPRPQTRSSPVSQDFVREL
jgi:transposase